MTDIPREDLIEDLARQLDEIGRMKNSSVLLYAEAGDNWAGGSVFVDRLDTIEWVSPVDGVIDRVMDLWEEAPAGKKWRGMTMFLDGDEFHVEFDYGEGWSPDEHESDRRLPIVRKHFGDKPIYYPPLEGAEPWA